SRDWSSDVCSSDLAHQQHGLGKIERGEAGIDGHHDDSVREGNLVRLKARPFRTEDDPTALTKLRAPVNFLNCLLRRQHWLREIALPRCCGADEIQVGDSLGQASSCLCRIDDEIRARGRGTGFFVWPAVAWIDQAQIVEPEVRHGAGGHADVVRKLRPHQDECRARQCIVVDTGEPLRPWVLEFFQATNDPTRQKPKLLASPGLRQLIKRSENDWRQWSPRLQPQAAFCEPDGRKTTAILVESRQALTFGPFPAALAKRVRGYAGFVRTEGDGGPHLVSRERRLGKLARSFHRLV